MLLSATKSRKKQQTELVQSVIHAEEQKRRKERENFHITSVPVMSRAAYEPSLYSGGAASDEHGGVQGDESKKLSYAKLALPPAIYSCRALKKDEVLGRIRRRRKGLYFTQRNPFAERLMGSSRLIPPSIIFFWSQSALSFSQAV